MKPRLSPELRDVNQYHDVGDLRAVVPTRLAVGRRRAEAERLKVEAYGHSHILFHRGDWRIVRLEGFAAASFWGLGTRWCTTTSKEIYDQYVRCSPLLVLLTPRGRFQLQVGGQFKDAADNDAAMSVLRGAPQEILTIVAAALEGGGIRAPS